jgi:hypothetical protein
MAKRVTRKKKGVALTSIEAHRKSILLGEKQTAEGKIYRFLKRHSDFASNIGQTRNEIAEMTGLRVSRVCGAVDVLLFDGLLVELDEREDRFTKPYKGKPLAVVDPRKPLVRQEKMFW